MFMFFRRILLRFTMKTKKTNKQELNLEADEITKPKEK